MLFNTDESAFVGFYGALRYTYSMLEVKSQLIDALEAESGQQVLEATPRMHELGGTLGLRIGTPAVSGFFELGIGYALLAPKILGERVDLGGIIFSPAIGLGFEV